MNRYKFFIFWAVLFFAQWSQAGSCLPLTSNQSWSVKNNVLTSVTNITYNGFSNTDVCRVLFNPPYSNTFNGPSGVALTQSPTLKALTVTSANNSFNTSDSTCWCDNATGLNSTNKTCQISGLDAAGNTLAPNGLLFKSCNPLTNVNFQIKFEYNLPVSTPQFITFCPQAIFTNLKNSAGDIAQPFDCTKVTSNTPTCALNVPSYVNLPSVKPSTTTSVRPETKKAIPIQLLNCGTNTAGYTLTPRVSFTDANGPSFGCDLKNMAATNQGGLSATNNSVVALYFDDSLSNNICLLEYASNTNNTLLFAPIADGGSSANQTQTIWAALRSGANDVGAISSKVMVKLDYR